MSLKVFQEGETICSQATGGNEMYIILSGRVKVYITINSENIEVGDFKEDEFFGEMSLLLDEARSATVKAVEETEVLSVDKDGFLKKVQEEPEFAWNALKTMAKRLKHAHEVISQIEGEKKSLEIMHSATNDLLASGVLDSVLKAGDRAPDFALADQNGGIVRTSDLLSDGPLVISFYRGVW